MGRGTGAAFAACLAVLVGCKRPSVTTESSHSRAERAKLGALSALPADALLVAVAPHPALLAERLGWPEVLDVDPAASAELSTLSREYFGIDIVELHGWNEIGVDTRAPGGFALVAREGANLIFFVELADPYRFQQHLHEHGAHWMGPLDSKTEGRALVIRGEREEVGLVVRGRFAYGVLALEPGGLDAILAGIAKQVPERSLAAQASVRSGALNTGDAALYFAAPRIADLALRELGDAPEEAALVRELLLPFSEVVVNLELSDTSIDIRASALLRPGSLPDRLLSGSAAPTDAGDGEPHALFLSIDAQPAALLELAELFGRAAFSQTWEGRVGGALLSRSLHGKLDGAVAIAGVDAGILGIRWWLGVGSAQADAILAVLRRVLPVGSAAATGGALWLQIDDGQGTEAPQSPSWRRPGGSAAIFAVSLAAFASEPFLDLGNDPLPAEALQMREPRMVELIRRYTTLEEELSQAKNSHATEAIRHKRRLADRVGSLRLRARRDGDRVTAVGGNRGLADGARGAAAALIEEALQLRTGERGRYEIARDKLWDLQSQLWSLRHEIDAVMNSAESLDADAQSD